MQAKIADVLPGTTFDTGRCGRFQRAGYEIAFTLKGEEPTRIDVEIAGVAGFAALKRLAEKTGWQAVDAGAGCFIDLDASRTAGIAVPVVEAAIGSPSSEVSGTASSSLRRRAFQGSLLVLFVGAPC